MTKSIFSSNSQNTTTINFATRLINAINAKSNFSQFLNKKLPNTPKVRKYLGEALLKRRIYKAAGYIAGLNNRNHVENRDLLSVSGVINGVHKSRYLLSSLNKKRRRASKK